MSRNSIIDLDIFQEKIDEIEKSKDKNLLNAVLAIAKFQTGEYLVDDRNTMKINTVTPNTVFAYNNALIKDFSKSYDLLEESIKIIYQSDYKDLLNDEIIIFDEKIEVVENENELTVQDVFKKDFAQKNLKRYMDENSNKFDYYEFSRNAYKENIKENHEYSLTREMTIIAKNKQFYNSNDVVVSIEVKDEECEFVIKNALSYNTRRINYFRNEKKPTQLDLSPKNRFLNNAIKETTGISLVNFNILAKKTEMFSYGYLTNSEEFISKQTKSSIWRSTNTEYTKNAMQGRKVLDNMNQDYQKILYSLQYSLNVGAKIEEAIKTIRSMDFDSAIFGDYIKAITELDSSVTEKLTDSEKYQYIEIAINTLSKTITTYGIIENGDEEIKFASSGISRAELGLLNEYLSAKRSVEKSLDIYKAIKKSNSIDTDNSLTNEEINEKLRSFILRSRASIYDTKVDSYVFDLRDGKEELNEPLEKLSKENKTIEKVIENIKENKFYDYFEFDKDFIDGKEVGATREENLQELLKFTEAIKDLNMPVIDKGAFKVRKLGNYGKNGIVTGIYSSATNLIAVDTRKGFMFNSVKHEETHRIDLNNLNKIGRSNLIYNLKEYFDKKINDDNPSKSYYLTDEELIARAGEVTAMLLEGNYKDYKKDFDNGILKTEEELWQKVKKDYEESKDFVLMKSYDRYKSSDEYIDFEKILDVNSKESYLVNGICFEYFKPFYENEKTDISKLISSNKIGFENREIEGIYPKDFIRVNYKDYSYEDLNPLNNNEIALEHIDTSTYGKIEKVEVLKEYAKGKQLSEDFKEQFQANLISKEDLHKLEDEELVHVLTDEKIRDLFDYGFFEKERLRKIVLESSISREIDDFIHLCGKILSNNYMDSNDMFSALYLEKDGYEKIYREITVSKKDEELLELLSLNKSGLVYMNIESTFMEILRKDNFSIKSGLKILENLEKEDYLTALLLEKVKNGNGVKKEDLGNIGINTFDEYKKKIKVKKAELNFSTSIVEIYNINKKILDSCKIEYEEKALYEEYLLSLKDYSKEYSHQIEISKETLIDLIESYNYEKTDKEHVNDAKMDIFLDNITKATKLKEGSNADIQCCILDNLDKMHEKLKELYISELSEYMTNSIVSNSFQEFNKIVKKVSEMGLKLKGIGRTGKSLFVDSLSTQEIKLEESNIKSIIFSSDCNEKNPSVYSVYTALKENDFDKTYELIRDIKFGDFDYISGIILALNDEKNIDIIKCIEGCSSYDKSDDVVLYRLKQNIDLFYEEAEVDSGCDLKKAVSSFLGNIKKKKSFIYGCESLAKIVCASSVFSKDIDENEIYSLVKNKSQNRKDYVDYKVDVEDFIGRTNQLIKFDNRNRIIGNKKEIEELKMKINKELSCYDALSMESRRKIADSFQNRISRAVEIGNRGKIKDLNDFDFHKGIKNINQRAICKEFLVKECIVAISKVDKNKDIAQKMKDAYNKLIYHTERGFLGISREVEEEHYIKGLMAFDKVLKSNEMLGEIEIIGSSDNFREIKEIEKFLEEDSKSELDNSNEIQNNIQGMRV